MSEDVKREAGGSRRASRGAFEDVCYFIGGERGDEVVVDMIIMSYVCEMYCWFVLDVCMSLFYCLFDVVYMSKHRRMLCRWMWLKDVFPVLFKSFSYLCRIRNFYVVCVEVVEMWCVCAFKSVSEIVMYPLKRRYSIFFLIFGVLTQTFFHSALKSSLFSFHKNLQHFLRSYLVLEVLK